MKVILQDNVDPLGTIGDVVTVRDGYARNFLIPRGKALIATASELKRFEGRRVKFEADRIKTREEAQKRAEQMRGTEVSRSVKVSDEGKLYGSVGVSEIADLLEEKGYTIEKKQILLPEPIKAVGTVVVPIRLHPEVTTEISVTVIGEKAE